MKHLGADVFYSSEEVDFTKEYCQKILAEVSESLTGGGFESFANVLGTSLQTFFGCPVETELLLKILPKEIHERLPHMFVALFKDREGTLYILDLEATRVTRAKEGGSSKLSMKPYLELDVFSKDDVNIKSSFNRILEILLKHFGIEGPKNEIVYTRENLRKEVFDDLKKTFDQVFDLTLADSYKRMGDARERELLRAVKRAKSLLARDIVPGQVGDFEPDRALKLLDFYSGADVGLIEKRFGVFCKSSNELICVLESVEELSSATSLECPRCKTKLQDEVVEPIYRASDRLKDLLDNSRWMPLQVKSLLQDCEISEDDILLSATREGHEFDVVANIWGRLVYFELKDKEVSLGDAYKFSAKISRMLRLEPEPMVWHRKDLIRTSNPPRRKRVSRDFLGYPIPVMITTKFLEEDAATFLHDTLDNLVTIEKSEETLEKELRGFVDRLRNDSALSRLSDCCFLINRDSVSNFAGALTAGVLFAYWNGSLEDSNDASDNNQP